MSSQDTNFHYMMSCPTSSEHGQCNYLSFPNFPTTAFKLLCKELTIIFNSVSHSGIHNPELDPHVCHLGRGNQYKYHLGRANQYHCGLLTERRPCFLFFGCSSLEGCGFFASLLEREIYRLRKNRIYCHDN